MLPAKFANVVKPCAVLKAVKAVTSKAVLTKVANPLVRIHPAFLACGRSNPVIIVESR